jgi:aminopeptidase-like protein
MIIEFCEKLYRIYRSITGVGVKKSLQIIQTYIPIEINSIKSGTKCFDWIVPPEWNVTEAFVVDLNTNRKVVDFSVHNLHLVGYSIPIDKIVSYKELVSHLYFLEDQPDAIPYVTSYYNRTWGFCLSYNSFIQLDQDANYHVIIKSSFNENGSLFYGELLIPGITKNEILLSTYICHPQMVNNELSGPAVLTFLTKHILNNEKSNFYSYRIIFVPETIGSIAYISLNFDYLKKHVFGGFNITCVGDERAWGHIPSRFGNNISDRIARNVLKFNVPSFQQFSWLDRGSDERQYCAPGVDLPISSITRSKYGTYEEYHTSLDNFELVTEKGLNDSLELYIKCLDVFEKNCKPRINVFCEPQLGKRGLYPSVSTSKSGIKVRNLMNVISFCDGENSLLDISEKCNLSFSEVYDLYLELNHANLFITK